ncbi:MAG: mechanosensitive ion channel domain-containing protein [Chloroflexota bacterium]
MLSLWEWFVSNGLWIILAIVTGVFLFVLFRQWVHWAIGKIFPKQWQEQFKGTKQVTAWILNSIGGVILILAVAGFIASRYGVVVTPVLMAVGDWLVIHGVRILFIITLSYLAYKGIKVLTPTLIERTMTVSGKGRRAQEECTKRAHTLSSFLTTAIGGIIFIMAVFMILSEVGIDITPLLAGAGVVGIAIGFGAQSLIKDFLNGMFIVLEDQYGKGDVVQIAGISGLVEDISLRRTVLRDLDGIVHTIPNGEIKTASNYTKEWSRVNLNIPVGYGENIDHVMEVLNKVGKELAEDKVFGPMITGTPRALRIDNFAESGIEIKILGETKPLKQWDVMGELRKRVKKAFDKEGIEIPWPHTKVYFGNSPQIGSRVCPACSNPNPADNEFCSQCGVKLKPNKS